MKIVTFRFSLEQEVMIKPIEARSIIEARMEGRNGHEYRVVYWHNGERKVEWVGERELDESSVHSGG